MSLHLSPVDSSMFDAHHYDPSTRAMTVRFKNGAVWEYNDVSPEKNAGFLGAESKGQYFNKNIRSGHVGRKVS